VLPDKLVGRVNDNEGGKNFNRHLVVIGASNASRLIPALRDLGYSVSDLMVPGWVASDKNINKLGAEIAKLNLVPGFGILIDILSNSTYRFEQFDGTLALPYKAGGSYHLASDITVCTDSTLKKIIAAVSPIYLASQASLKVIVPPMPRWLL
jgi:hypothetical protein